jgi:hypothetical protein
MHAVEPTIRGALLPAFQYSDPSNESTGHQHSLSAANCSTNINALISTNKYSNYSTQFVTFISTIFKTNL